MKMVKLILMSEGIKKKLEKSWTSVSKLSNAPVVLSGRRVIFGFFTFCYYA